MEKFWESWSLKGTYYRYKSLWRQVWRYRTLISAGDWMLGVGIGVFFAFFFYRSVWAVGPMLLVGGIFIGWNIRKKKRNDRQLHLEQFKECVLSVLGSLKAGYAVENAFAESIQDMETMYGTDCWIGKELKMLCRGLQNNKTMENTLIELGQRSGLQEIIEFAEVFGIAKRNSGNIPETIELYSRMISDKLDLIAELETLLAAKRLEQKVMNVMPFIIVLYLNYTNPGYFDMMYHSLSGVAIMSGCLVVYMVAYGLSEHIFQKTFE